MIRNKTIEINKKLGNWKDEILEEMKRCQDRKWKDVRRRNEKMSGYGMQTYIKQKGKKYGEKVKEQIKVRKKEEREGKGQQDKRIRG